MLPAGSSLSAWLAWLETLSPTEINLGLERVQTVLDRLPVTRPATVLTIGGTNGKGSCVAMTSALLRATGRRVGSYTSPHILQYNERIAIDGEAVADAEIVAAFEAIEAVRGELPLTYFEYGTLAAFLVFSRAGLDAWVLEVGMGGRLDAVNVLAPDAALITNVALDHCDWLGADVETIAVEKAGIMRGGIPVVFGSKQVPAAIRAQAATLGADLRLPGRDYRIEIEAGGGWHWQGPQRALAGLARPGLPGEVQLGNAAAVLAMLDAAGLLDELDAARIGEVLAAIRLTARMQEVELSGITCLLDVAHNPAAAETLAATLEAQPVEGRTCVIIGMLDDKDVDGIVASLDCHVDRWIAVTASSHRAIPAPELARRIANCNNRPCQIADSPSAALEKARDDAAPGDRIVVTGSFYLVGPVLEQLHIYSRPGS